MSSAPRKALDQGVSASRAGSAQKRPPPPSSASASRGRPKSRASPSSRRSADDSASSIASSSLTPRSRARTNAYVRIEEEPDWARTERVLLDRTLRLHSVSPLHFSSLPASIQEISRPMFQMLKAELQRYINLRLSDGFGFLEGSETMNARDTEGGDLRPPARRRRTEMGKVGKIRIGFLQDSTFVQSFQQLNQAGEPRTKPWVIEMELGKPASEDDQPNRSSSRAAAAAAAQEATAADLCHIVFLPGSSTSIANAPTSRSYPFIATKAPSTAQAAGDPLLANSATNVGPLVLTHALDWIQKRFDCRISTPSGSTSIASQLKGKSLEQLAELIVRQTRLEMGVGEGVARSAQQKAVDERVKPVELSFGFPSVVKDIAAIPGRAQAERKMMIGPAPELGSLTLTIPWEICMELLEALPIEEPLLPALNEYLSYHTSIPLDHLELVRIGVAGVNVGSGRIKLGGIPKEGAAGAASKASLKRQRSDEADASDRRRAGAIFGFLRNLAEGKTG